MGCRLTQNIQHSCEYNPGGVQEILLLDIEDFESYQFKDDALFDKCLITDIKRTEDSAQILIDVVNESIFTESQSGGIYKQELKTFVRTLSGDKTSSLLLASARKYLIVFRTNDDRLFSFGSDGGAALSFTQLSGQLGDASGYEITISKSSTFPLFELDEKALWERLLAAEDLRLMITESNLHVEV